MDGIFIEFENQNALRLYPFAAGCVRPESEGSEIPAGLFVDAALYPVNPSGTLYLSSISDDGRFSVSDDSGVIMEGSPAGNIVEFRDTTSMSRRVGVMVASSAEELTAFLERGGAREYGPEVTAFAASCVMPVVIDGVVSVNVGDSGMTAGDVSFSNSSTDDIRISSTTMEDGRQTLRFDVLARPGVQESRSIRRIICVVRGNTPFRIVKQAYNTVILTLYGIDRDDVCDSVHREDRLEMHDTCKCQGTLPSRKRIPYADQLVEVFIPPDADGSEGGIAEGSRNAFFLIVPNLLNYRNPLSITLEDGMVSPKLKDPEVSMDGYGVEYAEGAFADDVTSKGVILQVPGLSGGRQ